MDTLRISIELGNGGTSDSGEDLFKAELKDRIEITSTHIELVLDGLDRDVHWLIDQKLKEMGHFRERKLSTNQKA